MKKRKYEKKSPYWDKFNSGEKNIPIEEIINQTVASVEPEFSGESYYVSSASSSGYTRSSTKSSTSRRRNYIATNTKGARFANIREGLLPYDVSSDGVSVRDSIELCQKAYANIAIFRNAIDIMAELANSAIYVENGNEASRKFVSKWFAKVNLWNLKDQYFREYYRSGNVFLYRIDGKFSSKDFSKMHQIYGSEYLDSGKIPIRYILLNPFDIVATRSMSFKGSSYKKILSEYEVEKLQNPKTDIDKEIFNALPDDTKKKIKEGGWSKDGISIDLDTYKMSYSFYKKQDYEPFAIPFGFPVLDDINWKLELKKVDQAISRTIENVILLITMGASPDKGGINPHNLTAMQSLFQNESVGRVLVADYTTKAEFVIPDIAKVIGPEKYQIVNEDIRQGLQNVIVGDEKYKNTQVKAEIFLERLKEARLSFLNDFLQPQVRMVCRAMGFKDYPTVRFEEIDIKDEVQFQRVVTRLLEIGILTPEQGVDAIKTGIYPNSKDILPAQKEYVKQRQDGMYNPLVGGIPTIDEELVTGKGEGNQTGQKAPGRPTGTKEVKQVNKRSNASELYSRKEIQAVIYKIEALEKNAKEKMLEKLKAKDLTENQETMISDLCKSVILSKAKRVWTRTVNSCIKDFEKIEKLSIISDITELSQEHELEIYAAALLYHSK